MPADRAANDYHFVTRWEIPVDWRIRAEKTLLRNLSFILKPIFEANHRWAMAQGEICLKRELSRRHRP